FRSVYKQEQLLSGLIEQIKEFSSLAEMSRLVGQQVVAALHPSRLYIYYLEPDQAHLTLGYALDEVRPQTGLTTGAQLARTLATSGRSLASTTDALAGLPADE